MSPIGIRQFLSFDTKIIKIKDDTMITQALILVVLTCEFNRMFLSHEIIFAL